MNIEDFKNKVIQGDCLEVMKGIPDKSVDMVLTSPPYDNLRDYKGYIKNQEEKIREIYLKIVLQFHLILLNITIISIISEDLPK